MPHTGLGSNTREEAWGPKWGERLVLQIETSKRRGGEGRPCGYCNSSSDNREREALAIYRKLVREWVSLGGLHGVSSHRSRRVRRMEKASPGLWGRTPLAGQCLLNVRVVVAQEVDFKEIIIR